MTTLDAALGGMRDIPQWFVWRLVWDNEEQKYQKTPCALDGSVYRIDAGKVSSWNHYSTVAARVHQLNAAATPQLRYAIGFWMTSDCGY